MRQRSISGRRGLQSCKTAAMRFRQQQQHDDHQPEGGGAADRDRDAKRLHLAQIPDHRRKQRAGGTPGIVAKALPGAANLSRVCQIAARRVARYRGGAPPAFQLYSARSNPELYRRVPWDLRPTLVCYAATSTLRNPLPAPVRLLDSARHDRSTRQQAADHCACSAPRNRDRQHPPRPSDRPSFQRVRHS